MLGFSQKIPYLELFLRLCEYRLRVCLMMIMSSHGDFSEFSHILGFPNHSEDFGVPYFGMFLRGIAGKSPP